MFDPSRPTFYIERQPGRRRYISQGPDGSQWIEIRRDKTIWHGFKFNVSRLYERQMGESRAEFARELLFWRAARKASTHGVNPKR